MSPNHRLVCCFVEVAGSSVNLLKVGAKRRRTKQEITDEKEEARVKEEAISSKMNQFATMQQEINNMKQQMAEASQLKGFFESMINDGKLVQDADGNIDVPPGYTAGR